MVLENGMWRQQDGERETRLDSNSFSLKLYLLKSEYPGGNQVTKQENMWPSRDRPSPISLNYLDISM